MTPELAVIAEQFKARVKGSVSSTRRMLTGTNFDRQRAFIEDDAMFATASCSRRAGKSRGIATWLLEGPIENPDAPSLYFTISRKEAKRIMWGTMKKLNQELGLGYQPNESELILYRNGTPSVYLTGVNTKDEVDKVRGTGWGRVAGDEAQNFPEYVQEMVDDVLLPSFIDHGGKLRLTGTPAPVPVGFFYRAITNPEYSHHSWTVWDNPYLRDNAPALLEKVLRVRGVTAEDPSIQREWFGRWVHDEHALVFRYDRAKNALVDLPALNGWQYVVGVDLGFDDADAIAVLAWSEQSPNLYLVEEQVFAKQTISTLAEQLRAVEQKYKPLAWVADFGGLGKKIAIEVTARTGIPLEAADKERKLEHIELLNDAMRTGRFFARPDGRFAQESLLVEWDRTNPEKPKISDRFHSDIADAVLYAFRRALHWLHVPEESRPAVGTPEHLERQASDYEQMLEERYERERADLMFDTNSGWGWGQ